MNTAAEPQETFCKEEDNADLQTPQILSYFIIYKLFGLYSQNLQRHDY